MNCTWENCSREATHPQIIKKTGKKWADLCAKHDKMLKEVDGKPGMADEVARYWVKAQGGLMSAGLNVLGEIIEKANKKLDERLGGHDDNKDT